MLSWIQEQTLHRTDSWGKLSWNAGIHNVSWVPVYEMQVFKGRLSSCGRSWMEHSSFNFDRNEYKSDWLYFYETLSLGPLSSSSLENPPASSPRMSVPGSRSPQQSFPLSLVATSQKSLSALAPTVFALSLLVLIQQWNSFLSFKIKTWSFSLWFMSKHLWKLGEEKSNNTQEEHQSL